MAYSLLSLKETSKNYVFFLSTTQINTTYVYRQIGKRLIYSVKGGILKDTKIEL